MQELVYELKNTVLIIAASEFLKSFMNKKEYKKYIGISINLLVTAYLFFQISGIKLDIKEFSIDTYTADFENSIVDEYEKNAEEALFEEYEKNGIFSVKDIILESDERYNIISSEIYIGKDDYEKDKEKIKKVTEEAGIYGYEIFKADN